MRTLFALVPPLCLGALLACAEREADRIPWNVLILVADDLGVNLVGAYAKGADPAPTPNIDALAARGVLFRRAWSNPLCSPTRATIQTGRYSFRTGIGWLIPVLHKGPALDPSKMTLPDLLGSRAGYATAAFGKWHLGNRSNGGMLSPIVAKSA